METCDLHTHTTASDGSDSPKDLVKLATEVGLKAISITDHDTIEGLDEAISMGNALGINVIPGVELSVIAPKGNMHILGYFIRQDSEHLKATLGIVQQARANRNPKIIKKLNELGIPISLEMLEQLSKGGQIGRPHFARALVELGAVKNVQEAFEKYLKRGAKAYVPKSVLSPEEAIETIHMAGGLAVLAHPFSLKCENITELKGIVEGLVERGLDGMECYYSEHSPSFTQSLIELANSFGLVVTGGTDYHGKAKPYIHLGRGKGNLSIPYDCVKDLNNRLEEKAFHA
ncbi:putative metal-dependent phosphoesterases (PHP family) [Dissulfuribacter thermophilus]|uniref:Putative metal-dependent phosphoesterases (PHP family) n=1 Tax=Dissulfuribacter thermophilus TaxID=1156395 RepID=A0A1B9F9E3_9BACT|nr:PHP domain-containing protein [Dissulfuribacter thermophilus]OCC16475.1 putative metal-dependent phosphoesterases (PHP family) [Dissulfuribacter thermophilus]